MHAQSFCVTDEVHRHLLRIKPAYKKAIELQDAKWRQYSKEKATRVNRRAEAEDDIYEIPVVIHVIHTGQAIGTPYNPSDNDLISMIARLNAIFAANYDAGGINTDGSVEIPIHFKLAQRTPDCQPTNGINRVDGSAVPGYSEYGVNYPWNTTSSGGAPETDVKALSSWPNTAYLNIWIVTQIQGQVQGGGGIAGYAYYPGAPSGIDGATVINTDVELLAHEVGHFLWLYHTFEGNGDGSICPLNNDCTTDGDQVCDTEPHYLFGCNTGINACTNQPWGSVVRNFMNYYNCKGIFTAGQSDRMLYALENLRGSLLTSLGGLPPGMEPVIIPSPIASCVPTEITNPNNGFDIGPRRIQVANLLVETKGYTEESYQFYIDHTMAAMPDCIQKQPVANLNNGITYTITVTSGYNPENVRGWIDFNNDGVFQPSELIISSDGTTNYQSHTASFTVPVTGVATCTSLRMRISADYADSPPPQPCPNLEYGQTEDFVAIIQGPELTAPSVSIAANANDAICAGTNVTFTATSANGGNNPTYQWKLNGNKVGTNRSTYSNNALSNGDVVSCVLTSSNLCVATPTATSNSITMSVATVATPSVNIAASVSGAMCTGTSITFTATAINGGTNPKYQWKVGNTPVGSNSPTYTTTNLTNGTVVTCILTSNLLCASISTVTSQGITMSVSSPPSATVAAAGPTTFCAGKNVLLKANTGTGYTYQWKKAGINIDNATQSKYTATIAGTYSIMVTNASGCSATSAALNVTINPVPLATVSAASSLTFCEGKTVQLKAILGAGYTYQWKWGGAVIAGAKSSTYTASATGYYTVIVTNATGCSVTSAALAVVVKPLPLATITATGPTSICSGKNVLLKANTGTNYSYQWIRGAAAIPGAVQSNFSATEPGWYTVIVTNSSGCKVTSAAIAVSVNALPAATITPAGPLTFCVGQKVVLKANTGTNYTYQWKKSGVNIAGATQVNYTATASGVYSVVVTNTAGCPVTSAGVTVTVNNVPLATVAAASATSFCAGKSVLLKAITGTGYTYQWKKNGVTIPSQTQSNYTATATGAYTVAVTNAQGCSTLSIAINVSVVPLPAAVITANGPLTFPQGGNVVLNVAAAVGNTYQWKKDGVNITGATSDSYTANTSGSYTVAVTNTNGCQAISQPAVVAVTQVRPVTKTFSPEEDLIKVYPNPIYRSDHLYIDWNIAGIDNSMTITVYDLSGKKINTQLLRAYDRTVKLAGASGVYIVECRWGVDKRKIFKVIKVE